MTKYLIKDGDEEKEVSMEEYYTIQKPTAKAKRKLKQGQGLTQKKEPSHKPRTRKTKSP